MKRIALLGGSFNPIHSAHLQIAKTSLNQFNLDEIRFIPSKHHAFKGELNQISDADRIRLIELAIEGENRYTIDLSEINSKETGYTIDYVKQLDNKNQYFFIIGMDNLLQLDKWHRIDDLFSQIEFICFHRPDYKFVQSEIVQSHIEKIHFIKSVDLPIASSEIRELIRAKKDVKGFLPNSVHRYILDHQLYID